MDDTLISRVAGNTPVREVPPDYYPAGCEGWLALSDGPDTDKKQFFFDQTIGDGEPERTVVFVHGNPESSYTWRHVIAHLRNTATEPLRIVAMDHIGFGLSDQADFEMVDMHHSANLLQLVRHLDLQDVTLVIHDWGGPIGTGAFIEDAWRVRNLLVMNTTIFPMPDDGITYTNYPLSWLPWASTPELIPDALWGGVAGYVVSHAHPQGTARFLSGVAKYVALFGARRIKSETPEYVWSEMLRSKANARSSKRNVRQTPFWGHGYRYTDPTHGLQDNRDYYRKLHEKVPAEWGPAGRNIDVCGYFGQWDACGKDSVIAQWHQALPKMESNTFKFEDVGHFIEEYKGEEMAAAILGMNQQR